MSDLTPHPDDELVSAVLDGEATPAEEARVAADPALRRRLEEIGGLAARVAEVPPPDPVRRAAAISHAVDAAGTAATVTDLGTARRRRGRHLALSAAAAVVVVALGVGLLLRDTDDDTDLASDTTEEADGETAADDLESGLYRPEAPSVEEQGAVRDVAPAAEDDASGLAGPEGAVPDLGSFSGRGELSVAVTAAVDDYLGTERAPASGPAPSPGVAAMSVAQADCATRLVGEDGELTDTRYVATATLDGRPLTVLLFATDPDAAVNGSHRLYVVAAPTCRPLAGGVQTID